MADKKSEIKSHRDLIAWQKAMDLVVETYKVSQDFPKEELYGAGLTFFEVFDEGDHRKKNVSPGDVEEILRLIGFSKDDYLVKSDG